MNPKTPRPPTLGVGRAGTSKGLGGTFEPLITKTSNKRQYDPSDWSTCVDQVFLHSYLEQGASVLLGPFAQPYSLDYLNQAIEDTFPELAWHEQAKFVGPLIDAIHWLSYAKRQNAFNERYSLARLCRMIAKCCGVCAPGRTGPGPPHIPLSLSDQPIEALLAALMICGFTIDQRKARPEWWTTNIGSTGLSRLGKRGALPTFTIQARRADITDWWGR
jgi:hypothetical protein